MTMKFAVSLVFISCSLCFCFGASVVNKVAEARELCSLTQATVDCLDSARNSRGAMGGWRPVNGNGDDYIGNIVNNATNILKKSSCLSSSPVLVKVMVKEVYTQVVAGLNICMSVSIKEKCGKNTALPCDTNRRMCSVLAYKPPGAGLLQASDIKLHGC